MKKFEMKKLGALAMAVLLLLTGLGACGTDNDSTNTDIVDETSSANDSKEESANAESASAEPQEIVMWGSWSGDQIAQLEEQIAVYNNSQDKYVVKYVMQEALEEKLLTGIAGGDLPDVLMWDRYNTSVYASRGALEPIDNLVARDDVDLSVFYEAAVDEATGADGKLYGLPLYVDVRILFYNKSMFAEAGVDSESIKTWDDLEEAAVKLTKRDGDKLVQAGFSLKDCGLYNIWSKQAGASLVDDSTTPATTAFNTEEGLSVLKFWDKLLNEDKVYELGFEDSYGGDGFKAGVVAIAYNGPWALSDYNNAGIDYGVIANPVGPNGDTGAFMGGFSLAMPAGSKNKEGAWDFMKWWTTQPENEVNFSKISGWLPANVEAAADSYFAEDEYLSVFVDVLGYASIRPKTLGYSDVEGLALIPQLQKFVAGEITAEDALAAAQEQGDQIFADYASE